MANTSSEDPSRPSQTSNGATLTESPLSGSSHQYLGSGLLSNDFYDPLGDPYSSNWYPFLLEPTPPDVDHEKNTEHREPSRKRKRSMSSERSPAPRCRCPCPIFEAEVEQDQEHTCNGGGGNNMSELRLHMTRGNKVHPPHLPFLRLCKICNHDFIDEDIFNEKHGKKCHKDRPQRKGAAADSHYQAFKAMVLDHHTGRGAVSTEKYVKPENDNAKRGSLSALTNEQEPTTLPPTLTIDFHSMPSQRFSPSITSNAVSPSEMSVDTIRVFNTHTEDASQGTTYLEERVPWRDHSGEDRDWPADYSPFEALLGLPGSHDPWSPLRIDRLQLDHDQEQSAVLSNPDISSRTSMSADVDHLHAGIPRDGEASFDGNALNMAYSLPIEVPMPLRSEHSRSVPLGREKVVGGEKSPSHPSIQCEHPGCWQIFRGTHRRGTMHRHMRLKHCGHVFGPETNFHCEVPGCGKTFRRQDARLKHLRNKHPELGLAAALPRKDKQSS